MKYAVAVTYIDGRKPRRYQGFNQSTFNEGVLALYYDDPKQTLFIPLYHVDEVIVTEDKVLDNE